MAEILASRLRTPETQGSAPGLGALLAAIQVSVPPDQAVLLGRILHPARISKGEFLIREGDIPERFAFSLSGLFRYYYVDAEGRELTKGFIPRNHFVASYSAMIEGRASYFSIQALEDADVLFIGYRDWKSLLGSHPCWSALLIQVLEYGYITKESREREFLLFDAETRYRSFLRQFPDLEGRVKQYIIASYLGITPVALSRIRKKMSVNTG